MKKQLRLKRWVRFMLLVITTIELMILTSVEFNSILFQFVLDMFLIFALTLNTLILEYY